jgi:pimeloyl-ACP methyl ester carboxylesterase
MSRVLWVGFFKRIFLGLIVLLALLACAGAGYEHFASQRDQARFPQTGTSVDAGGFQLNLDCRGSLHPAGGASKTPAVILESGLGVPALGWALVEPGVSRLTRVCSYDRAGYGWSAPGPDPRTADEIVRELHSALGHAGIPPPYVLVGHSFGGMLVRVFAARYPGEVAGMVLVDASHEEQDARLPPSMKRAYDYQVAQLHSIRSALPILRNLGIARLLAGQAGPGVSLPKDLEDEFRYLQLEPKYLDAELAETAAMPESEAETRAAGSLGDRPLIVLTASKVTYPANVPAADAEAFHKMWVEELQLSLVKLSTRGRQVMVDATHLIPLQAPQAVVAAIEEVLGESEGAPDVHAAK